MARIILKIKDDKTNKEYYLEWSTIIEAPVTYGLSLAGFKEYYKDEYGKVGLKVLEEEMERINRTGTNSKYNTAEYYFENNQAGRHGACIDKEEILNRYCRYKINTVIDINEKK